MASVLPPATVLLPLFTVVFLVLSVSCLSFSLLCCGLCSVVLSWPIKLHMACVLLLCHSRVLLLCHGLFDIQVSRLLV